VPKYWSKAIEPEVPGTDLNVRMKRDHIVTASALSWDAHVTHNAADSAPRHKHAGAFSPNFIQFAEELFIFGDVPKLGAIPLRVFL
jgi:hypothetical protein